MGDLFSAIASPIVEFALQKLATLIREEYLALAGLENDVQQLKTKLTDINKILETAENGPQNPKVTHILADLKDATYNAVDVLDMVSTEEALLWDQKQQQVRFYPSGPSKWIFRLKNRSIPDKIKNIMKKFDDIRHRFSDMKDWLEHVKKEPTSEGKTEPTCDPVPKRGVVGRKEEEGKIKKMLLSDRYNVEGEVFWRPITGMGGIGKTTLAQQVYADDDVTRHFSKKIWVPVSNRDWEINRVNILEAIKRGCVNYHSQKMTFQKYDQVMDLKLSVSNRDCKINHGPNLEATMGVSPQGTPEEVVQSLVEGLKLLVVLDDVWSEDFNDWKNLEKILLRADKGTRVIVTSQSLNVHP